MIAKEIKDGLYPIYKRLLTENTFEEDVCGFCVQWGENYPFNKKHTGLLFVGKAVNGWIDIKKNNDENDLKELFNIELGDGLLARKDQMKWVENTKPDDPHPYVNRSAFWRVIKTTTTDLYPTKEPWYSNIAWSNLYKVSGSKGGNPRVKLQKQQREYCFEILKKEIELLAPKYVIMFTSGWEEPFLYNLNGNKDPEVLAEKRWGEYETILYKIKGVNFIVSPHPQGKKQDIHVDALIKLINKDY